MIELTDTFNPGQGVIIFTDGSASVKDRTGGWAWYALDCEDGLMAESGYEEDTTISRMELTAAIMALEYLWEVDPPVEVILIVSDSKYVVEGFNDKSRARNKNGDLWEYLEVAATPFNRVEFEHIPGHQKSIEGYWNNCADKAASAARLTLVEIQTKEG